MTRLLSVENVDRSSLMKYAQEAARFSTDGRLPLKDFALNHYGEPDVALFDFTSMYAAENASIVSVIITLGNYENILAPITCTHSYPTPADDDLGTFFNIRGVY